MHILLVLEQGAVQRRNRLAFVVAAQGFRRNIFGQQQFYPVEQFGRRRFLLQSGHVPDLVERVQRLLEQVLLQVRIMHVDDLLHRSLVRELDVVKETAAQERVRQFFFIVARYDDDRPVIRRDELLCLVNVEFHAVEFLQQVVRKLDVRLVDLVDQQHRLLVRLECFPDLSALDVVARCRARGRRRAANRAAAPPRRTRRGPAAPWSST